MKNKDLLQGFLVGVASTAAVCVLALAVVTSTFDKPAEVLLNKSTTLEGENSKITSITYKMDNQEKVASVHAEDFAFLHFKGIRLGCRTILRGDCGISSKKDGETLIKVIEKSIELGWLK